MIAATLAVAAGLLAANMLGVAAAEAPGTATTTTPATATVATPPPTVRVDGVASEPIAQSANMGVAKSVYREAMAAALADAQSKAEFLVSKAGVTLGSVQSIGEGDGSIECTGEEESRYVEYQGEQPDFGSRQATAIAPAAASAPALRKAPLKRPGKKTRRKPTAKAAATTTCSLTTDVAVVYTIS